MAIINNLSTNIIPSVFGDNIIRNVYNLGGSTACDAGNKYCTEGYGLYFPCLKSITKGQDVCFDFYVTDKATQDVVDLRDVDGISLDLIGAFGCPFGTFSYPDNIKSLQSEEFEPAYQNSFSPTDRCHLTFEAVCGEIAMNTLEDDFYFDSEVKLTAYDTPTHIFVTWIIDGEPLCSNAINGDIKDSNEYSFTIREDTYIAALYRPRKEYNLTIDDTNRNSHFNIMIYKDGIPNWYMLSQSNSDQEVKILEGYHFGAICSPNSLKFEDSDSDSGNESYAYVFLRWNDDYTSRARTFCAGIDTGNFEKKNNICLKAICGGPVGYYDIPYKRPDVVIDEFDEEGIHIISTPAKNEEFCEFEDDDIIFAKDIKRYILNSNGYMYLDDGVVSFSPLEIDEGIKVCLAAKAFDESCDLTIRINGMESTQTISPDEFMMYEYYFRPCESSPVEISVNGKCLIDYINIYKENIIDKGKAALCLGSDVTANLPSGKLSVSGAISVDGKVWGLPLTQIGEVNRLTKINII